MKDRIVAGIRCSEVLGVLSEYVDGELDAATIHDVEQHLLGCPNCERFGANFGAMVVSLRKEAEVVVPLGVDVMTRLFDQIDEAIAEP